jgi:hypothetical protein
MPALIMPFPLIQKKTWQRSVTFVITGWTTDLSPLVPTMFVLPIASISETLMTFKDRSMKSILVERRIRNGFKTVTSPFFLRIGTESSIYGIQGLRQFLATKRRKFIGFGQQPVEL